MLEFDEKLRETLADKALDTANIAAGALVFGQALGDDRFSPWLAVLGFVVWAGFVVIGAALMQRRRT